MRKTAYRIILVAVLVFLGLIWVNGELLAQGNRKQRPGRGQMQQELQQQLKELDINIPFVDRDGDGINDLMQSGWGLRFLQNYKRRQALWNQLNVEGRGENDLVDTDGDGVPDTPFHQFMGGRMNQLVDTDGDGVADAPLRQHLRRRFQTFDKDGDGIPDVCTPEEIHQYREEMMQWRREIRQRILNGETPFLDENGDGIPDNLPQGFARRWKRGGGGI